MTATLAPNLFDRRFQDFIELGRARLRPLAPEWTDHNAHDPGITLMELLAWVAEAQLYSVGHLRRDERAAFASLMGLNPRGTRGATGAIWPNADPSGPALTFSRNVVLSTESAVHVAGDEAVTFRPEFPILWTPGRVTRLESRSPGRAPVDLTAVNARGATPFRPFGERAGRRSVLALSFACRDDDGLFGRDPNETRAAYWSIGVLAAASDPTTASRTTAGGPLAANGPTPMTSPLTATLVADGERYSVPIVSDSSRGMLTSGTLVLDMRGIPQSPRDFTIELAPRGGLPRPPRVLRVSPNVIPVRQGRFVHRELHVATGQPDWSFVLDLPGLRFEAGAEPVEIEVAEEVGLKTWTRTRSLPAHGPDDRVYELDATAGKIRFGNGINGRIPSAVSQVLATYAVSDGEGGNLGRNRPWNVAGFGGVFGTNPEPTSGGAAAPGQTDERREARRRSRDEHALVNPADVVQAARATPLLEVARAWVAEAPAHAPRTGEITLVAIRARTVGAETAEVAESPRWLESIRRRLAPRLPLGSRLVVRAPRYVDVIVRAEVEAAKGWDPAPLEAEIRKALHTRLAVVALRDGTEPRDPGDPVTRRDVAAWIRSVAGVRRILSLELRRADGLVTDRLGVGSDGLPRWRPDASRILVSRPEVGTRPAGGGR